MQLNRVNVLLIEWIFPADFKLCLCENPKKVHTVLIVDSILLSIYSLLYIFCTNYYRMHMQAN